MATPKFFLSISAKFAIGISITVSLFGFLNILIVKYSVEKTLNDEVDKRGNFVAKVVSEQAISLILSDNTVGLNKLVNEINQIDSSIYYIFILNAHNEVIANSFKNEIPQKLINANKPLDLNTGHTVFIQSMKEKMLLIKDFSLPVMSTELGTVRVGILESKLRKDVDATLGKLTLMVIIFLLLGITGAFIFAWVFTTPISRLSTKSEAIDLNNIEQGIVELKAMQSKFNFKLRRVLNTNDEIDVMYEKIIEMFIRLEQAHSKLHETRQSLIQSEKLASLGTLTAGLAHELNNPLAGINNCLQRIAKKPEDIKQTQKYVELMQEALNRIEFTIKELLNFSRKDTHVYVPEPIAEIINKAIQLAHFRIDKYNIDIVNLVTSSLSINVVANRIEQVILNILFNAIDAIKEKHDKTGSESGEIKIELEELTDFIELKISDNGIGIPENMQNQIFDPFFTTKDIGKGTGLGLSVSYQVVAEHGGDIKVESISNMGTTFYIRLPKNRNL